MTGLIEIKISTDGGSHYSDLAKNLPNTGSHIVTIPDTPSSRCLIRVKEKGGGGAEDESDGLFTINHPPVFDPIGDKSVTEKSNLNFNVLATDADGDPLIYSAAFLPDGSVFDPLTRTFDWTPTYEQAGDYSVAFLAYDGYDTTT